MELTLSKDQQNNLSDFCNKLSKSKMVPMIFQGKPDDIYVTILMGNELGISPIMALQSICVIQGSVTLKVQTMNSVVRSKCPSAIIDIKIDHSKREARVNAKRSANDIGYESLWTMDMAKQMGLAGKDNWIKQPLNMLKARALSDALRAVFPDILMGLYSSEEMSDIELSPNDYSTKVESIKIESEPATKEILDLLFTTLDKIDKGEERLIKHINQKDKSGITKIEQLTADQVEYALGFLAQFMKGE